MNLLEAIKSGKRFRRKSVTSSWYGYYKDTLVYQPDFGKHAYPAQFNGQEVLAADWELEEEKIEITEKQLEQALLKRGREIVQPPLWDILKEIING